MIVFLLLSLALIALFIVKSIVPNALLAQLPAVPLWKSVKGFLTTQPFDTRYYTVRSDVLSAPDGISRIWIGGRWIVQTTNPEYARHIMTNPQKFPKVVLADNSYFKFSHTVRTFGRNLVGTVGNEWKRHRTISSPAFSKPLNPEPFAKSVEQLLLQWDGIPEAATDGFEVYSWMQRLTLDVLGRNIFSFDFESLGAPEPSRYVTLYNDLMATILTPASFIFPLWSLVPTAHNVRARRLAHEFRELLGGMVSKRLEQHRKTGGTTGKQETPDASQDLLDMMVESAYGSEKDAMHHLSQEELINDLAIFFVAGHDTTSNSLSIALHYLAANPDVQTRAREHVRSLMQEYPRLERQGDEKTESRFTAMIPSADAIRKMNYIHAIIKESLRLYPSASSLGFRRCTEQTHFGPHVLPQGTWVQIDIFGMHRDPRLWEDPTTFNPDRFLSTPDVDGETSKAANSKAWIPFGGGNRICLGMQFSLMEQKVALAMLLQAFRFKLPDTKEAQTIRLNGGGLLRPEGLKIILERI
ncbi:cytochrome P450 [Powellomyces hirtus]|nr:cytochrome P450 [Powellomyces hirtus]